MNTIERNKENGEKCLKALAELDSEKFFNFFESTHADDLIDCASAGEFAVFLLDARPHDAHHHKCDARKRWPLRMSLAYMYERYSTSPTVD